MEKLRNDISSFVQMHLETLYDAWERYKDLLRKCPHYGLPLWLQVQTFHNGLNPSTRLMIDVAAGGTINNKTPEEAYEFIEEMSLNNYQWQVMRTKPTKVHPVMQYDASGGGTSNSEYPPYGSNMENEQMNYMGNNLRPQNNPYSNTYNAGSLPSNTKTNPREQLYALTVHNDEGLVEDEPKPRQDNVVDKGKVEMPNTVKFLKELLSNKRKLDESSHVELNVVCSAILQNKLPNKLKDPGSFMIPCLIGSLNVNNALADLGASINVLPYKMFKQLGLGKPKKTRMSIQLADKTIRFPRGIIEDVLVKIDKFIFPVDFVVLDMD
ncbi:hypothetical protein CXB51_003044 [Gossypium anomalum]|uniref:Retrotransposon gag domain-containing protein n=1 Tax=Gossypium anomalum TaxID=47600 RepID=A0A8J6DAC0_9ROSI|nr:hypothetical protein CXB51_003044 [Gossypium anomalum]